MITNLATGPNLTDLELEALLTAAQDHDRRADPRYALFTSVTLRPASAATKAISAFSREISVSGIGLLHAAPLVSGETYEIDIRIEGVRVRKSGLAIWCRSVSDNWYLSGLRFV